MLRLVRHIALVASSLAVLLCAMPASAATRSPWRAVSAELLGPPAPHRRLLTPEHRVYAVDPKALLQSLAAAPQEGVAEATELVFAMPMPDGLQRFRVEAPG